MFDVFTVILSMFGIGSTVSKLLLTSNNSCGLRDLVARGLVEINAVEVGLDEHVPESQGCGSGRIQSGQWIRIRIRNPDPNLGGQKPQK